MLRGEVWYADLGTPPGRKGREQSGNRPVVVLQNMPDPLNPMILIAPFTSSLNAAKFPHSMEIIPDGKNGLSDPSILMLFQLRALDKKRFNQRIGFIIDPIMAEIDELLMNLLGLSHQ